MAAAVSGLNPERITIVDDRGVALDEGAVQTDDAEIETSLQSALDAALGAGATLVRVRIEYDPRHDTVHDVKRTAIGGPPISAEHVDERFVSHDTRYAKATHSDERGTELHDVQSDVSAPRVARISVAIAVAPQFAPESPEIRNLAIAAAGLNLQRGDVISVQAFPFQRILREKKDAWWLAYGALVTFAPKIIVAVAVLVAARWAGPPLAEGFAALGRRARVAHARSALEDVPARQVHGALAGEPPHAAAAIISALPAATAAAVLDLYPPEERTAIVRRMSRTRSALIPDYEALLADG
ncbi:MAG: hypothetical protein JO199_12070 [Candidatus Eremiobacteraeota bacterium]|nr:hypothetical protein [Candidatus Eremiobacteraeota bacterium]